MEIPIDRVGAKLPSEPASYRLTASTEHTEAEFTFRSAGTPTRNTTPSGLYCYGSNPFGEGSTLPCRPEPLVYVGYDLDDSLALDNTTPAGRSHSFRVLAYHSPSTAPMPAIAGVELWASTDDGAHWVPVQLRKNRDGSYTATARYPRYLDTTGSVSLRAEAWDVDGNGVRQTTARAFGLRDTRSHWGSRTPL